MSSDKVTFRTPCHERERRYRELRKGMELAGLEALIICGRGDPFSHGRIQYVSDIFQWAGWGMVLLPQAGEGTFIVDPLWGAGRAPLGGWVRDARATHDPGGEVAGLLADLSINKKSVGIVGLSDTTSAAHLRQLQVASPNVNFIDATDIFDDIRAVKSDEEIARLTETCTIIRGVFDSLSEVIRPGIKECDLLAEAHYRCRQQKCLDGIAIMGRQPFDTLMPGTDDAIRKGDVMAIDLEWSGPSGYWVELRRNYSFGPPPADVLEYWKSRIETFDACVKVMRPGAASSDIIAARDAVSRHYDLPLKDSLGYSAHGIGLDCLEVPWVPGKDRILRENMVISLHPGVAFDDPAKSARLRGITIADNVVVTPEGGRRLADQTDEWVVIG